jgi:hypothetical protein
VNIEQDLAKGSVAEAVLKELDGGERSLLQVRDAVTPKTLKLPLVLGEACLLAALYRLEAKGAITSRLALEENMYLRYFRKRRGEAPLDRQEPAALPQNWKQFVDTDAGGEPFGHTTRGILLLARKHGMDQRESLDAAIDLRACFRAAAAEGVEPGFVKIEEVKAAAKLIARAKYQTRSWFRRTARRTAQTCALAAAIVVAYTLVWIGCALPQPNPGTDYHAMLNSTTIATPIEQHAWPAYRKAFIETDFKLFDMTSLMGPTSHEGARFLTPGDPGWEHVPPIVTHFAPVIDAARAGADKPSLGLLIRHNLQYQGDDRRALPIPDPTQPETPASQGLAFVSFPHLGSLSAVAQLLAADMSMAAESRDMERFLRDFHAIAGVARHCREGRSGVCQLVGVAVMNRAMLPLLKLLQDRPEALSDADLAEMIKLIENERTASRPDALFDRLAVLDVVQRIYSDNGAGDGRVTLTALRNWPGFFAGRTVKDFTFNDGQAQLMSKFLLPYYALTLPTRRDVTQCVDSMMVPDPQSALIGGYAYTQEAGENLNRWELKRDEGACYRLVWMTMGGYFPTTRDLLFHRIRCHAVRIVLALEQYRRLHGQYPDKLAALMPDLMTGVTAELDAVTFSYRIKDGKPLLYAVSPDQPDSGGECKPDSEAARKWPMKPEKGDWVFFPAVTVPIEQPVPSPGNPRKG